MEGTSFKILLEPLIAFHFSVPGSWRSFAEDNDAISTAPFVSHIAFNYLALVSYSLRPVFCKKLHMHALNDCCNSKQP